MPQLARLVSLLALWGLIALVLWWAFAFAADRQDGGWPAFALFVAPLLLPLPGMWRGQPKAFLLSAFISMLYLFHGLVTVISSPDERTLGTLEAVLGLILLTAASLRSRWGHRGA